MKFMTLIGWLMIAFCIGMSVFGWFAWGGMTYVDSGEPARLPQIIITILPLFGIYFAIKWDWENRSDS